MKVKASFTISKDILAAVDRMVGKHGNRSAFVEAVLREAVRRQERAERDARDIAIYNKHWREIDREVQESQELLASLDREEQKKLPRSRRRRT